MSIGLYTVDIKYIEYLSEVAPHMYVEKLSTGARPRKYVGIILAINGLNYFAPLTSYKEKHNRLSDSIDFLKIENVAAININMMFPVPEGAYHNVNFKNEKNTFYKNLMNKEYRYLKANEVSIKTNAMTVYNKSINCPESKIAKRCNDFKKLEDMCLKYKSQI